MLDNEFLRQKIYTGFYDQIQRHTGSVTEKCTSTAAQMTYAEPQVVERDFIVLPVSEERNDLNDDCC